MTRLGVVALAAALALVACGAADEGEAPPGPANRGGRAAAAGVVPAAADVPEYVPPEAAALAAEVVDATWNQDKTTRLAMHITTLVDRRSGIKGFGSTLRTTSLSLDQRLAKLGAETSGTEVIIRLPGSILFDFDSADIRPDADRTLSELAAVLGAYGQRPVRIEGHTDAIASDVYNQRLSESRAKAVRDWLVANGVAAGRLATHGVGESRPVADNATAAGRQRNRRVEVVIETG